MIAHKGIDHLTALISAGISIALLVKKDESDDKLSYWEMFNLIGPCKDVIAAFKDPGELPLELADLDAPEAEQIVRMIEARFGDLIPAGRAQDITDAALGLLPHIANLINNIVNPPPKALPA